MRFFFESGKRKEQVGEEYEDQRRHSNWVETKTKERMTFFEMEQFVVVDY